MFVLNPAIMKTHLFPFRAKLGLFQAAIVEALAVTVPVLNAEGKVIVNWMPATEAVVGSKVIGIVTAVPASPEAVPTVNDGAARAGAAQSREQKAEIRKISTIFLISAL